MTEYTPPPDHVIVGAPKCGTTSLYNYLEDHPSVYMSPQKEPHFFNADLVPYRDVVRERGEYLSLFVDAPPGAVCGEASTWYLFSEEAANKLYDWNPSVRIIIMLRDPVDMIWSMFKHNVAVGNEDYRSLQSALDAEQPRQNGRDIPDGALFRECLYYREAAKFSEQVKRYISQFGRNQVHVIILEEFAEQPSREYKRVLDFLGVSTSRCPEFDTYNASTWPRSFVLRDFLRNPPEWLVEIISGILPKSVGRWGLDKLWRANQGKVRQDGISASVEANLRSELKPDVLRLEDILGRSVDEWDY